MAQCKICKASSELDETGRCSSCRAVYEASRRGITYGMLMSTGFSSGIPHTAPDEPKEGWKRCVVCGKLFIGTIHAKMCSDACRDERKSSYYMRNNAKRMRDDYLARKAAEEACGMATPGDKDSSLAR